MRSLWRRVCPPPHEAPVAAAGLWLVRNVSEDGGLPLLGGDTHGACGTTGLALPALTACGQRRLVQDLLPWLLARQLPGGAFPDAAGQPCRVVTADVLSGLLSFCDHPGIKDTSRVTAAAGAAGDFLAQGPREESCPGSLASWAPPSLELVPLAALYRAGRKLNEPRWTQAAQHAALQLRRANDVVRWNMPTHLLAAQVQAMLDLSWQDEARRTLALPAAAQRTSGEIPALADVRWVSSSGLARLALCWYQVGDGTRADAALAVLLRRQSPDGGFRGSWGRDAAFHPRRQTVATACWLLQAALRQVAAAFERRAAPCDEPLAADDGRLRAVRDFLTGLPPGSRVADIGCGQGRYVRWLRQAFPEYRWIGIDASAAALAQLPEGVEAIQGSLLDLPVEDGRFDAVCCVEALEHALLPQQAIAELCRVLRPGGRAVVIDKHRDYQRLSEHQPWEIWFAPAEVCEWLSAECDNVTVAPIPHGNHRTATGLFHCWTGTRRMRDVARAA